MKRYSIKIRILFVVFCLFIIILGLFFINRPAHDQNQVVLKETPQTRKITVEDFSFIEDEILRKHLVAQENAPRIRVDSTNGGDEGVIQEVDISDPNNPKSHTRSFGLVKSELIVIGNSRYERSDNSVWKKRSFTNKEVEALMGTSIKALNEDINKKRIENTKQFIFEFIGKEKCGDLNCYKYKKSTEGTNSLNASMYFWFDDKEYLLRKDLMETPEVSVTTIISYDNIEITPPEE